MHFKLDHYSLNLVCLSVDACLAHFLVVVSLHQFLLGFSVDVFLHVAHQVEGCDDEKRQEEEGHVQLRALWLSVSKLRRCLADVT